MEPYRYAKQQALMIAMNAARPPAQHGKERMYKVYHCRCPKCTMWQKRENAKRYKK